MSLRSTAKKSWLSRSLPWKNSAKTFPSASPRPTLRPRSSRHFSPTTTAAWPQPRPTTSKPKETKRQPFLKWKWGIRSWVWSIWVWFSRWPSTIRRMLLQTNVSCPLGAEVGSQSMIRSRGLTLAHTTTLLTTKQPQSSTWRTKTRWWPRSPSSSWS